MSYFAGGTGTSNDPFLISTPTHLNNVRYYCSTDYKYFKLINDINLDVYPFNTGYGWLPLPSFRGYFDGNGFKIKKLYINRPSSWYVGLFGEIYENSTIVESVVLEDVEIYGGSFVGSISGFLRKGTIKKCKATGVVSGNSIVGGFVGESSGLIRFSKCNVNVSGIDSVGGFAGIVFNGNDYVESLIFSCKNTGSVNGSGSIVGGFIGQIIDIYNGYNAKIADCFTESNVSGNINVSGFIGYSSSIAVLERCISICSVVGNSNVFSFSPSLGTFTNCLYNKDLSNTGTGAGNPVTTSILKTDPIGSGIYSGFSQLYWFTKSTSDYPDLEELYYKVTFTAGANGTLSGELIQRIDFAESGTFVTANPNTGYQFEKWSDNNTENPRQIKNAKEDLSLTAIFDVRILKVSYSSGYNGKLIVGGIEYDTYITDVVYGGDVQPVTIVPNENYSFIRWSDGLTNTTRQDLDITDDITVYAILATDLDYEKFIDIILNGNNTLANTFSIHFFPQTLIQYKNHFLNQFIRKSIMYDTGLKNIYTENNNFSNGDGLHLNAIINSGDSLDYRVYDYYDKTGQNPLRNYTVFSINKIDFTVNIFSNIIKDSGIQKFKYTDNTFNKQRVIATKVIANDGIEKKLRYIKLSGIFSKLTLYIMVDFPEDMFYNKLYKIDNSLYNSFVSNGKISSITIDRKDFEELDPKIVSDRKCEVLLDVNRDIRFKPVVGRNFTIVCVFDFVPTEEIDGFVTKNRNILRRLSLIFEELPRRSKKF